MTCETDAVKAAILYRGLDDWVHVAEVVFAARHATLGDRILNGYPDDATVDVEELSKLQDDWLAQEERDAIPLGIAAVKGLLRDRYVRIGYTMDGRFVPWEGSFDEIEYRIDRAVEEAEYPLLPGHLFWLENTATGSDFFAMMTESPPISQDCLWIDGGNG